MFNIGMGELLIVLIVAFVIVGPDDLPKVARWLGRQLRQLKLLIRDIKAQTGIDEVEKEIRGVQRDVKTTVKALDVSADLKTAVQDIKDEASDISKELKQDIRQFDEGMKREIKALDMELKDSSPAADGDGLNAAREK